MDAEQIRDYIREQMLSRIESAGRDYVETQRLFQQSRAANELKPEFVSAVLNNYRQVSEVLTYIKVYREAFPDSLDFQVAQHQKNPIDNIEKDFRLIKMHVETIFHMMLFPKTAPAQPETDSSQH